MAFSLDFDSKSTIEVVCSKDLALDMTDEQFNDYVNNPEDKGRLVYKEGMGWEDTTRFVLKKILDYKAQQKVMKQQVQVNAKGQVNSSIDFMLEEVRQALIDIKNPPNCDNPLEFKRGSDGKASEELVVGIYSAGVLMELYSARNNSISASSQKNKKK